ncbi:hypothetical protein Btru_026917 [Bulinus truncatus]|nr:hypothetical protein Btru_026917 [Bulinus truncatus]
MYWHSSVSRGQHDVQFTKGDNGGDNASRRYIGQCLDKSMSDAVEVRDSLQGERPRISEQSQYENSLGEVNLFYIIEVHCCKDQNSNTLSIGINTFYLKCDAVEQFGASTAFPPLIRPFNIHRMTPVFLVLFIFITIGDSFFFHHDDCKLDLDREICNQRMFLYYYSKYVKKCTLIPENYCNTNNNRFKTLNDCEKYCVD